jgi:hypothetical protein
MYSPTGRNPANVTLAAAPSKPLSFRLRIVTVTLEARGGAPFAEAAVVVEVLVVVVVGVVVVTVLLLLSVTTDSSAAEDFLTTILSLVPRFLFCNVQHPT